jgi:hypothetical protein
VGIKSIFVDTIQYRLCDCRKCLTSHYYIRQGERQQACATGCKDITTCGETPVPDSHLYVRGRFFYRVTASIFHKVLTHWWVFAPVPRRLFPIALLQTPGADLGHFTAKSFIISRMNHRCGRLERHLVGNDQDFAAIGKMAGGNGRRGHLTDARSLGCRKTTGCTPSALMCNT